MCLNRSGANGLKCSKMDLNWNKPKYYINVAQLKWNEIDQMDRSKPKSTKWIELLNWTKVDQMDWNRPNGPKYYVGVGQ